LRVFRNLDQHRAEARSSTWLYRITYNVFLAYARKSRSEIEAGTEHPSVERSETQAGSATVSQALRTDAARAVARASVRAMTICRCRMRNLPIA